MKNKKTDFDDVKPLSEAMEVKSKKHTTSNQLNLKANKFNSNLRECIPIIQGAS